jgi:hypothetical protein
MERFAGLHRVKKPDTQGRLSPEMGPRSVPSCTQLLSIVVFKIEMLILQVIHSSVAGCDAGRHKDCVATLLDSEGSFGANPGAVRHGRPQTTTTKETSC